MALERIVLNIIPEGEMPVFHCSQYENGRPVIIDLVSSDDDAFLVPEGATIELHCRKVDDNIVTLEPNEVDNNTVTFVSTEQLTACPGDNLCEVVLYADTDPVQTIATLNFILHVEPDPMEGGLTSETQIHNLTEQIEEITQQVIGDDYYNKTEVDGLLAGKADKATTYTKTQVDSALVLKANSADLATVATTGDYDDLLNKPTIPAAQVQSDWSQADNTQVDYIKNKPDIEDMINNALFDIMPVATEGPAAICSFDTEIAAPLVSVSCAVVATGGNGTPDNPIPINGYSSANITRCGKNLAEIFDDDTVPSISNGQLVTGGGSRSDYIKVKPSTDYTFSVENSQALYIFFYQADKTWINYQSTTGKTLTKTTPANCAYVMLRLGLDNQTVGQFEKGSTATAYAPYTGNTYTIAFGQTVYGGVLDVTRGKLHVTWLGVTYVGSPDENWEMHGSGSASAFAMRSNVVDLNINIDAIPKANYLEGISRNATWGNYDNWVSVTSGRQIVTGIQSITDVDVWKTYLSNNPLQVAYELATPFDIDLTPEVISAIVGTNNVYSDTNGDTTVQFKDSIQHYIDSRT